VVRVEAAGVNFIDVYHRTGLYKAPLPVTLGQEAAGTVEAVAPDVTDLSPGDRVAWAGTFGGYAEKAAVPADRHDTALYAKRAGRTLVRPALGRPAARRF